MVFLLVLPLIVLFGMFVALAARSNRVVPAVALVEGRLRPCPETPNCVSSEAGTRAEVAIAPLALTGSPEVAWGRAQDAIRALGGRVERAEGDHVWASFRTRYFRFVDDLELRLDRTASVIHVRSGSRVGHSDLGKNRRRVEALRAKLAESAP